MASANKPASAAATMSGKPAADGGAQQAYDHMFKLVMIGDAGVGKSSILLRFTDDRFEEDHLSTIGVDLRVKFLDLSTSSGKKRVKVVVWDTAGQERFRNLTSSYYHKVQGIVLVYDVTKRETFENLNMWNNEIDVNTDGAPVVRVLVGNKIDDSDKRQVSRKEAEAWAHEHNMLFVESSAKTRVGVQQVFTECIMQILDNAALVQSSVGATGTLLKTTTEGEQQASSADSGLCCS